MLVTRVECKLNFEFPSGKKMLKSNSERVFVESAFNMQRYIL